MAYTPYEGLEAEYAPSPPPQRVAWVPSGAQPKGGYVGRARCAECKELVEVEGQGPLPIAGIPECHGCAQAKTPGLGVLRPDGRRPLGR